MPKSHPTVVISLLRAVNVGGRNKIKMDALRALHESLGHHSPQTFIQSGNVVFRTTESNLPKLAARIETELERTFGFRPDVILRTASDLRRVVAHNPFAGRDDIEGGKLLVTFLAADPSVEAIEKVCQIKADPEEVHLIGREMYIYFPDGMGQTKLPVAAIARTLKTPGTARNWNSVLKLLAMAEKLEASA